MPIKEGVALTNIVAGKRVRNNRFSGDYHFEQEGLDLSDSDDGKPKKAYVRGPYNKGPTGGRTKDCPGCGAKIGISVKECAHCDHTFTSKAGLQTAVTAEAESASIRERFPFEPEREDDGSLKIQAIIGRRLRTDSARSFLSSTALANLSAMDAKYDHEYLIKYKSVSYRGVQWLSALDIDAGNVSAKQMLSRYLTKVDRGDPTVLAEESGEIDPTFLEIEMIMDVREEEVHEIQDDSKDNKDKAADAEAGEGGSTTVTADVDPTTSTTSVVAELEQQQPMPSRTSFASISGTSNEDNHNSKDDDDAKSEASDGSGDSNVALTKMQIFSHVDRCRKVLEKIWDDPLAAGFIEPVDTDVYDDYEDIVEEPMSLQDVRERLEEGWYRKSGKHTNFVQDLRLIWKACKTYNLYKSQIWHSAHVLSMLTERLYQAWVVSYKDATIGIDEAFGRPWEDTCRLCCNSENEEQVILCDHCDASYHIYCLKPALKAIPEGTWVCPRCTTWLETDVTRKLLTATQEDEARELTLTAAEKVVVKVRKKKYLVKWRGLSYRDCTWELQKDIDDDSKIAEFHLLNENPPEEPPLTQEELDLELRKDRARPLIMANVPQGSYYNPVFDMDAEIYAQIRSYHFLKWNQMAPAALLRESGPELNAYANGYRSSILLKNGVVDTLKAIENGEDKNVLVKKLQGSEPCYHWWSSDGTPVPEVEPAKEKEKGGSPDKAETEKDRKKREKKEEREREKERKRKEKEEAEKEPRKPLIGIAKPTVPPCDPVRGEVAAHLGNMLVAVARGASNGGSWWLSTVGTQDFGMPPQPARPKLPSSSRCPGEHEICVRRQPGAKFGFRVANYYGRVCVAGINKNTDNPSRADVGVLDKRMKFGDILVSINGVDVRHLPFQHALAALIGCKSPYTYLRFLRTPERGGPEGAAERAQIRAQKLQKLAADRVAKSSSVAAGSSTVKQEEEEDEDVVLEDDPEQDVVVRYHKKYGMPQKSLRVPAARSKYQGVFPTKATTADGCRLPDSWTAVYWQYPVTAGYSARGNEHALHKSDMKNRLWNKVMENKSKYQGRGVQYPESAAKAFTDIYADWIYLKCHCVTLPPQPTELEAALLREKAMLEADGKVLQDPNIVPGGWHGKVAIQTETLNFVTVSAKVVEARANLTPNTLALTKRVEAERKEAEEIAIVLKELGKHNAASSSKAAPVMDNSESPSLKKNESGKAASSSSSSAGATKSPVKIEAEDTSPRAAASSSKSKSSASIKQSSAAAVKKGSKALGKNFVDEMDEDEEDEFEDDEDEEEEEEDEMSVDGPEPAAAATVMDVDDDAACSTGSFDPNKDENVSLSYDSMDSDSVVAPVVESSSEEESDGSSDASWDEDEAGDWKPRKQMEEQRNRPDGPTVRLLRATNEATMPPKETDWERYLLEQAYGATNPERKEITADEFSKSTAVDQVDPESGSVVRTWSTIAVAATQCSVSPKDILDCVDKKRESAGGFKWRSSTDSNARELAEAMELLDEGVHEVQAQEAAAATSSWRNKLYKTTKTYKTGGTLRDYQLDGLNWLLRCWYQKRSSILADEMGLGKTVQVVTSLEHMYDVEHIRGPFLVCVPLSTISHWQREFEGWSNMNVCVYHDTGGGRDMRDIIREYQWYYKGRSRRLLKFQTLICTYDDLIRDYEELAEIPWRICVVDEAHRLRNVNSKLLECMRAVLTKGMNAYGYQHRMLLTGTPLQNNTAELWSLLNFIEPAKFPDADKFSTRFGTIRSSEQVEALQKRIAPHLLRRVKEDVAKDIPPKEETIIDVELTTMQKQYYRAIYEHNHGFLMQNLKGALPKLMNIQMELRKCCNHPFLVQGVEDTEMDAVDEQMEKEGMNAGSSSSITASRKGEDRTAVRDAAKKRDKEYRRLRMEKSFIPSSGKMVLLDKLLPKLRKEGHKVLIFSQMVRMIDYIEEYCDYREYPHERLDGRVSGNDRQKGIDRFNSDPNAFVYLLSTRAGGVGINLTAADTCIIFDSDWNPQNDVQAMARCHRIGQKKQVTIYRLITRKSFEAEMFDRASRKLGLEQAVLGTRAFDAIEMDEKEKTDKVDAKEMEQLLREGAYAVLMEDDDGEAEDFLANDIDQILQKRAHTTITEAGPTTESWLNKKKKRGRTKKSVFKGDDAGDAAEIDVNDPDFWKKVLPDLVTPDSMVEIFQSDFENAEEPPKVTVSRKYFKDLSQMMKGLLDLNSRSQLPQREKEICQDLLLRITLKTGVFSEKDREQARTWLSQIEGSRSRKQRMDLSSNKKKRKGSMGASPDGAAAGGQKPRKSRAKGTIHYLDDDEEDDVELDMYGLPVPKKRNRPPAKKGGRGGAGASAAASSYEDYDDLDGDDNEYALQPGAEHDDMDSLGESEPDAGGVEDEDDLAWGSVAKKGGKKGGRPKGALNKAGKGGRKPKEVDPNKPKKPRAPRKKKEKGEGGAAGSSSSSPRGGRETGGAKKKAAAKRKPKHEELDDDDEDDIFGGERPPPPSKRTKVDPKTVQHLNAILQGRGGAGRAVSPVAEEDDDPYAI